MFFAVRLASYFWCGLAMEAVLAQARAAKLVFSNRQIESESHVTALQCRKVPSRPHVCVVASARHKGAKWPAD